MANGSGKEKFKNFLHSAFDANGNAKISIAEVLNKGLVYGITALEAYQLINQLVAQRKNLDYDPSRPTPPVTPYPPIPPQPQPQGVNMAQMAMPAAIVLGLFTLSMLTKKKGKRR